MPTGLSNTIALLILSLSISFFPLHVRALAAPSPPALGSSSIVQHAKRGALSDPAYLPAQIAGIVGSYAISLVIVALLLLVLSKKRREHLRAAEENEQAWESNQKYGYGYGPDDEQANKGFTPEPSRLSGPSRLSAFYYQENPPSYRDGVYQIHPPLAEQPRSPGHVRNFSLPSPTTLTFETPRFAEAPNLEEPQQEEPTSPASYFLPSPTSTTRGPLGQDPEVPQDVVQRDRAMAQGQLEQMYKYVMEQEDAKAQGVEFRAPMVAAQPRDSTMTTSSKKDKKEKNKPASLNLSNGEKRESRTASFLSALKSPGRKKKPVQGISISSPIMTPMSGTFPQYAGEEMSSIPPRHYAPAMLPPMPMNHSQTSFGSRRNTNNIAPLMTPPDLSPEGTQTIDERMDAIATAKGKDRAQNQHQQRGDGDGDNSEEEDGEGEAHNHVSNLHARHISLAISDADPVSAVSEHSTSGLLTRTVLTTPGPRTSGLPTSPKPGVTRFSTLPASPRPGQTFAHANAPPSAVRTGGTLPLRAYENAMLSPMTQARTVKETVFQRAGPLSPGGMHTARTPMTGNPVPYSPYQPFSPVVPITPSLVTREDRKRMRRLEPKTPTLQMVQSSDDVW